MDQYEQWKTKRRWRGRILGEEGEWEEDDDEEGDEVDDDAAHVNEAQTAISPTGAASEGQAEKKPVEHNARKPVSNEKGEGKQRHKEDEGIVYSDTVGSKESDPLPPRPPAGADVEGKGDQMKIDASNEEETHSSPGHTKQHARSKVDDGDERDMPADTIFDDLLRGFAFAAFFCLALVCLYKCCWYTCVRCGILPDERVLEARWRRWQLRKKRSYRNATTGSPKGDVPPLDTRQWGKWMAEHDADGEDGHYYSTNRDEDGVWDDEDHSVGAIDFDDGDLVEMASWHEDAASEMELEYGEDIELEDRSHDARLFDEEDAGEGVQKEASKFFGEKKSAESKAKEKNRRGSAGIEASTKPNEPTPGAGAGNGETNVSDDHFFDALQKSNDDRAVALGSGAHENGGDEPSSAENDAIRVDEDGDANDEGFPSRMLAEEAERGYDEETDLLGLRSDSPPPLDLAEIEKGLVEQMEQAKFY
ncbi:hypothetical protein ACHAXT_000348 [Thalassiosira profunda]